jgi:FemAB-related protein (PEP-CTERM system-associated)
MIRIEMADASQKASWDRYVEHHQSASVYHLFCWRDIIERVFRRKTYYLMAKSDSRIIGVLPLVRLRSLAFGDFLVSLPYLNYGGVLSDTDAVCNELASRCSEFAEDLGVSHAELRHSTDCISWQRRTDKISMRLKLPGDGDKLWTQLGSKLRAQIKRPLREGVTCEIGGHDLVDDFYSVFSTKYRDLGVPVYPKRWFTAILNTLPHQSRIFVVRLSGRPVAASLSIGFRGTMEVPWASSLRAMDRIGANMYLYWNMLKYALDHGYQTFDFGRSTKDSGTYRFKRQWGATPMQLYWHYWLQENREMPQLNLDNPKYQFATAVWRKLPVPVANFLGPRIVKNLP